MRKYLRLLYRILFFKVNYNTILFNFKYFPFKIAMEFPVLVSKNVYLRELNGTVEIPSQFYFGMISIGEYCIGVFDEKYSRSIWQVSGKIIFRGKAFLGHGTKLSVGKDGLIDFGKNFSITAESCLLCSTMIKFGDDVLMSWDIQVMDTDLHSITDDKGCVINPAKEIKIGNHVWIGSRSLILKGANIPDDSIIGAQSVVSKSLADKNTLYVGSPVRAVKRNINWIN